MYIVYTSMFPSKYLSLFQPLFTGCISSLPVLVSRLSV